MYSSETQKIRPLVEKYCSGLVLDIGCGNDKIVPHALGVDCRKLPTVDVVTTKLDMMSDVLPKKYLRSDCVYSSHCLENFGDDKAALKHWASLVKLLGYLVLYLSDDRKYPNHLNPEHLHRYEHQTFLKWFKENFTDFTSLRARKPMTLVVG
jgi:predicted SAM-dependent methyltransferase